jgi:hypothetical protein
LKNNKIQDKIINPYLKNSEEFGIWEVLVRNDFEAFIKTDDSVFDSDYLTENFFGLDLGKQQDTSSWKMKFSTLEAYRKYWLQDSRQFQKFRFLENPKVKLYESCKLDKIDIKGAVAMVVKKFDGEILLDDSTSLEMKWKSIFLMRKQKGRWLIAGFCGYMK